MIGEVIDMRSDEQRNALLRVVEKLNAKYEFSKTITPDYYEPGNMENLDQYRGEVLSDNTIVVSVDVKGLRYENRSFRLRDISVGDSIRILRDSENEYNSNNFNVVLDDGFIIGTLPSYICDVLAPLFDVEELVFAETTVSYIEQITERSRYAKQGIMFVRLVMNIK